MFKVNPAKPFGLETVKYNFSSPFAGQFEFKKAKLRKPIHFALSYDEEVGCIGAHDLAARMASEVPKPAAL